MSAMEKVNSVFAKLPFKAMAEKIPEATQAKAPILKKAIPFANQIVCALAVVVVVVAVACGGGGGGGGGNIGKLAEEWTALGAQKENLERGDTAGEEKLDAQIAKINEQLQTAWADASAKGASYKGESETLNKPEQFEYELTEDGAGVRIERMLPATVIIPLIINVPAEIEGYPVVEIGDAAFIGGRIIAVTLPDSVTKLGSATSFNAVGVFSETTRLKTITLPPNLTEIGGWCFQKSGLTSITIPASVTAIGELAFRYCNSLTEVVIPEGVTTIRNHTFANCEKLTTVTIPDSVTTIWGLAFEDCPELTTVNIPSHPIKYLDEFGEGGAVSYNEPFNNCPKLSLAVRKAIQDTGYEGDF